MAGHDEEDTHGARRAVRRDPLSEDHSLRKVDNLEEVRHKILVVELDDKLLRLQHRDDEESRLP